MGTWVVQNRAEWFLYRSMLFVVDLSCSDELFIKLSGMSRNAER